MPYREAHPAEDDARPRVKVAWVERTAPLAPGVAAAHGDAARALARRLLRVKDEDLARWRGVAGARLLVVMGERESLPWVDGVAYLGRDPAAPSLWLPTTRRPDVPLQLFERAVLSRAASVSPPLAVLVRDGRLDVVSLAEARPVAREVLTGWAEGR